jgi:hypothetical protein
MTDAAHTVPTPCCPLGRVPPTSGRLCSRPRVVACETDALDRVASGSPYADRSGRCRTIFRLDTAAKVGYNVRTAAADP